MFMLSLFLIKVRNRDNIDKFVKFQPRKSDQKFKQE